MNLIEKIQQAASRNASAPAFVHDGRALSYRDFYTLLCVAAEVLHKRGIRPGDVVGLSLDHSPPHIIVMLALIRLGAVSVPLHPMLTQPQRMKLVAKYGVGTIISHRDDLKIDGITFMKLTSIKAGENRISMDFTDYMPNADTPFRISLSSGTTGEPKGVLLTQGNLLDRIEKMLYECDNNSKVIPFDLNFALGFIFAIGVLTVGGTVVLPRSYKPQELIEAINLYGVTHVFLSPMMLIRIADLLPNDGEIAFPTLKHLRVVGGKTSKMLLESLLAKFSPHVYVVYGLTELGPISIATPEILAQRPDSSGKIQPWAKVEICDEAEQALPTGESGEIRVMTDAMPTEYYMDAQQSRLKFRNGWYYTGDHGRISEEGLLFIEGRRDDVINLDGHKLSPSHVEDILIRHPDVREAIVFAMEDDSGEQSLVAAVIPRVDEIRQDDLAKYAKQQLGLFYPKRFFVMKDFPRNPSGKVIRAEVHRAALTIQ